MESKYHHSNCEISDRMINKTNATTDFYHPDTIHELQESGCKIDNGVLMHNITSEPYLFGNALWLTKVAEMHQIPIVSDDKA